ncbi:MAG: class I SAM-dependent methyltransferase, partial [Hyphomicrobiales bacterium]
DNMIDAARELGLDAHVMDGHALEFDGEFDAVFSNAALHWMLEPTEVIKGVKRALKPGGRFAAEFGGYGNVAAIVTAMHGVAAKRGGSTGLARRWFFPSPPEYQQLLEEHGFEVHRIGLYPRPTPLPTGMRAWMKTMCTPFFAQFGDDMEKALDEALDLLAPALQDWQGDWHADYVRLRVEARLP